MFLHLRPEYREPAAALLRLGLDGIATVMPMDEALQAGLFGPPNSVSPEFRRRLGDVLVLPHLGHFVWWREGNLISNRLNGHHGGLSREELVTVLGVVAEL